MEPTTEIDVGRYVECDNCGEVLTDDTRTGGYIFVSRGVGPCCAEQFLVTIRGYNEEHHIRARCPEGTAFADWIRDLRSRRTGGNRIRIYQGEDAFAALHQMVEDGAGTATVEPTATTPQPQDPGDVEVIIELAANDVSLVHPDGRGQFAPYARWIPGDTAGAGHVSLMVATEDEDEIRAVHPRFVFGGGMRLRELPDPLRALAADTWAKAHRPTAEGETRS